jgi:Xaa-Pro dipeptidase
VRDAVEMTESAFDLLTREARPGVPERVVYGKMVGHMIELGSIPPNFLMWSVGNPFRHSLAPFPTARPMRAGEVIHVEIEARNTSGYLGQITRTAILGRAPDQLREMFAICRETIEDVMGRLRSGRQMRDVLDAYKSRTKDNRYSVLPVIHARALGEDRPMVIFNTEDPAVLGYGIEKNQTFAVKAQVRDDRSGLLAFWGKSICVGDAGAIRSGKHPIELAEIS